MSCNSTLYYILLHDIIHTTIILCDIIIYHITMVYTNIWSKACGLRCFDRARLQQMAQSLAPRVVSLFPKCATHGSFLIRRQRGHPGEVFFRLSFIIRQIIRKACNWNWAQLKTTPIRNESNLKLAMCTSVSTSGQASARTHNCSRVIRQHSSWWRNLRRSQWCSDLPERSSRTWF